MPFGTDPLRIFERPLGDRSAAAGRAVRGSPSTHPLAIDSYRRGNDVWLHVDLPGVPPRSTTLDLQGDVLTISAERIGYREADDLTYRQERPAGRWRRSVRLGPDLDLDRIEADHHDGVLTIRIPVAERARARSIPIPTLRSGAIDVESSIVDRIDDADERGDAAECTRRLEAGPASEETP